MAMFPGSILLLCCPTCVRPSETVWCDILHTDVSSLPMWLYPGAHIHTAIHPTVCLAVAWHACQKRVLRSAACMSYVSLHTCLHIHVYVRAYRRGQVSGLPPWEAPAMIAEKLFIFLLFFILGGARGGGSGCSG